MSFIYVKPLPFSYPVHFNGASYYYTDRERPGVQISKGYRTIEALHRYGKIMIWN